MQRAANFERATARRSLRRAVGVTIVLAATAIALEHAVRLLGLHDARLGFALTAGLMAAGCTALGTLPVALSQRFSRAAHNAMLGFGAGVMLAASCFSLIVPALRVARVQGATDWEAGGVVSAGLILGAALLMCMDRLLPQDRLLSEMRADGGRALRRAWLFVLAICVHNIPEGAAIGVAFGGTDVAAAQALATGISIQDVPEGLVVALALRSVGYGRWYAVAAGVLSGITEPLFAVLGAALMSLSTAMLPWGLAGAAGAMLYVITHDVIPESQGEGTSATATPALLGGFVLMMLLDTALG